jgi:hypothetical protein
VTTDACYFHPKYDAVMSALLTDDIKKCTFDTRAALNVKIRVIVTHIPPTPPKLFSRNSRDTSYDELLKVINQVFWDDCIIKHVKRKRTLHQTSNQWFSLLFIVMSRGHI